MVADNGSEAVANARSRSSYEQGMCQKFTRESWEVGSLYGSAIEAWNGATEKHPGDRTPPTGAPCYYRGGQYGHAVVFMESGGGDMRSTDCQTTGRVSDADLSWPEKNWGYTFLGWTGDINAQDLPLGDEDDMAISDQDAKKIADEVWERLLSGQPDGKDRYAWATLVNTYNQVWDAPKEVWDRLLSGMTDAPDGRKAGPTLANIHNMVREIKDRLV